MKKQIKMIRCVFSICNQLHSAHPISFSRDGHSRNNSDDAAMVHSLLDLVDTSAFHKKQKKRKLHEIDSWEILNLLLKQQ